MSKGEIKQFNWSVVGHANIVSYLQQNLKSGNIAQAFLFYGPPHLGKTTVVKYLVNSLVCRNLHEKSETVPCGKCECCKQVANNIHPDVYWLKRGMSETTGRLSKNISIEQIRQLQNMLGLHSFLNSYKIAVINEAETLSQEAANSLLKTLEEPASQTIIILIASGIANLPKTIASRCQAIKFLPVATQEIFDHLLSLKIDRKKAKYLAGISLGRPGMAVNLAGNRESYEDFQESVRQFVALADSDLAGRFKTISELSSANEIDGLKQVLLVWRRVLRDLLLIKNSAQNLISNLFIAGDLNKLADHYSRDKIIELIGEIGQTRKYLDANVNPKLALENLIINL